MADRIQLRRDTKARWTQYNPILLEGEEGYELDSDQYKIGDGIHAWNDLPYRGDPCLQQTGTSTTTPMSQKAVTDELNAINSKVEAIASGTEVVMSLSAGCIYKNVATPVTITANVTGIVPETLKIIEDSLSGTILESGNNVRTLTANKTFTLSSNTKNLYGQATYQGLEFSGSIVLNARFPIYYGFSEADAASELTVTSLMKQAAKTVPSGTYTLTNDADGNYMWLCIPEGMHINRVTLNGFDVPMESVQTVDTATGKYLCYRSSNTLVAQDFTIVVE